MDTRDNKIDQDQVVHTFYLQYQQARLNLFTYLTSANPEHNEMTLLEKTQTLLDRVIFVCFCEDRGVLPKDIFRHIVRQAGESSCVNALRIWHALQDLFRTLDQGYAPQHLPAFKGGLFTPDPVLDNLKIDNRIFKAWIPIIEYDFASDLNVNILGHIFEQSISDLEEMKARIRGTRDGKKPGKRKRDGIYYTFDYITQYIVEEAVGGWLAEKQRQLGVENLPELHDEDDESIPFTKTDGKVSKKIEKHVLFWEAYQQCLMQMTVLDPACGAGAFLNRAFDFLYHERQYVQKKLVRLGQRQAERFDPGEHILSHNLFGVDLNNESVEITKLSLWLKTAKKHSPLPVLDDTIKTGNSLIEDPHVSGEQAFNWKQEFPDVFDRGGFDVIIGNPPYGAKLSQEEQKHLKKVYHIGSTETAILFIKRSYELLQPGGKLGFILPKAFVFSSNYHLIRQHLWDSLQSLVDCGKVWKQVKLEQVIITVSKDRLHEQYHSLIRRGTDMISLGWIKKEVARQFGFFLNSVTHQEIEVALKMFSQPLRLNDIATNRRGAGLQHAIQEEGDVSVIGGADIGRFGLKGVKGAVMHDAIQLQQSYINENSVLVQNIVAHIRNPVDHIKITACLPDKKDIVLLDTVNQITVHPDYDHHYIWCLLNSTLVNWYVYRFIFAKAVRTMHFDNVVTCRIPLPAISLEEQQPFIRKSRKILLDSQKLRNIEHALTQALSTNCGPPGLVNSLKHWHGLHWKDVVKKLKSANVTLSPAEEAELLPVFENHASQAAALAETITREVEAIESMICTLYGVTETEQAFIQ